MSNLARVLKILKLCPLVLSFLLKMKKRLVSSVIMILKTCIRSDYDRLLLLLESLWLA